MGDDACDERREDVESAADKPPAASESSQHAQQTEVAQQERTEGRLSYTIIVKEKDKLFQPTERELTDFPEFINHLRRTLAEHPDNPNFSSSQKHPLLAKPHADHQQLARWIEVKLQVVEDEGTWSTTLFIRDDNVDIVGFMNQDGVWFVLDNRCMLPPGYSSESLQWGFSYKSILNVGNEEEVAEKLESERLGKAFATKAVRLLSCYGRPTLADRADIDECDKAKRALVGLAVIICESAKLNPVHEAIALGWDKGNALTKQLMTDYVGKYEEISRRLRYWKATNYPEPHYYSAELDAIYLVLNGNEEYTMGDLISHAYPEVLKVNFPGMFKVMSLATVQVNLRRTKKDRHDMDRVYGKIAALISDKRSRDSVRYQVGSMLFTRTEKMGEPCSNFKPLELARSVVAVPYDWALHIKVDLRIEISNATKKDLEFTFNTDNGWSQKRSANGVEVELNIKDWRLVVNTGKQYFPQQLSHPMKILKTTTGHPTVVYTIGDAMSFTEFIMALRRILADHPDREDILDGHELLNVNSTQEHPLLAKMCPKEPARWLHVTLQVDEGEETTSSTTLVMRDDDLYVHGFFNQDGVLFKLRDNMVSESLIPKGYHNETRDLEWGVTYPRILQVGRGEENTETSDQIVAELKADKLGSRMAKEAVRRLSCYKADEVGDDGPFRKALVYLLILVCESARMNPVLDSVVDGWSKGTEFTHQMLTDYVWKYRMMSEDLRTWKSGGYAKREVWKSRNTASQENTETHPISQLQAIYLVHGGPPPNNNKDGQPNDTEKDTRESSDQHQEDDRSRGGGDQQSQDQAGSGGGEHGTTTSTRQHGETCGAGPSQPRRRGPKKQSRAAGDAQGLGRHLVEVIAIRANPGLVTSIIVYDEQRGQNIYKKENSEEDKGREELQKMVDLALTGPNTGISAYAGFTIKIETPPGAAAGDAASGSIDWEWDCKKYSSQVDASKEPSQITMRSRDNREVAVVTYAVMSNALEATVEAKLQLKDGHIPGVVHGNITAHIRGFNKGSVLFKRKPGMGQDFSPMDHSQSIQLSRNVVAVPCGLKLRIKVDIAIRRSSSAESKDLNATLDFINNGTLSQCRDFDGDKVEVKVTWCPQMWQPDVVYTIGDELSFTSFIMDLRRKLVSSHAGREDIIGEHALLPKQRIGQPVRWFHVKLKVADKETSTTLVIRDDNVYLKGFMNQKGEWHELTDTDENSAQMLPANYRSRRLPWGVSYTSILSDPSVEGARVRLNRKFAEDAVCRLSCYPNGKYDDDAGNRMALAGMVFMVCEAARMTPHHDMVVSGWNNESSLHRDQFLLLCAKKWKWGALSRALLLRSAGRYSSEKLDNIVKEHNALGFVKLVLNAPENLPPLSSYIGRPLVEILAVRSDFRILDTTITVLDGKRGQVIYRLKGEQRATGFEELVLTGPYRSISAYGSFAIKIDIPADATVSTTSELTSQSSPVGDSIVWEWNGYDPKYTKEVNKPLEPCTISSDTISSDRGCKVEVTYAVMSNALEATVEVKLWLKGSPDDVHGEITARTDAFEEEKYRSVLFRKTKGTGRWFSPTKHDSWFLLELTRNVVAVPCGTVLDIKVALQIATEDGQELKDLNATLNFTNGLLCQCQGFDDHKVEVNVAWYPEIWEPDVMHTIGHELSFYSFIVDLRRELANHPDWEDLLDGHEDPNISSTKEHPLLPKRRASQPARWLHVKLQVVEGDETSSTTLVMRDDNLYVIGFMNQQGVWYELVDDRKRNPAQLIPSKYNPTLLGCGSSYNSILGNRGILEIMDTLKSAQQMGRRFAMDAVRRLSSSIHPDEKVDGIMSARLELVGLMLMICESAKMNPVLDSFAGGWNTGEGFDEQLIRRYVLEYGRMSRTLLQWKKRNYAEPHPYSELRAIHLVLNIPPYR